jgi:meiosis-specific serine/threonine-protein kinase MEK1
VCRGAYSVIHLAFNTKTLRQVACKVMKTSRVHRDVIKDVRREVKILKTLQHPNINRVEDVVIDSERV